MSVLIMQASLLARKRGGIDPDAQAIFDMLTTPISEAWKARISNAFKCLKGENSLSHNAWARQRTFGFYGYVPTKELALIDWKRKVHTSIVSPTEPSWSQATGFGFTGVHAIDTGYVPSDDTTLTDNFGFGEYETERASSPYGDYQYNGWFYGGNYVYFRTGSNAMGYQYSSTTAGTASTATEPVGPPPASWLALSKWTGVGTARPVSLTRDGLEFSGHDSTTAAFFKPTSSYIVGAYNNGSGADACIAQGYGYKGKLAGWHAGERVLAEDAQVFEEARLILAAGV